MQISPAYPGWILRLNLPQESNQSSSSPSGYLAELCPHGASVSNSTGSIAVAKNNTKWSWSFSSSTSPSQWNVTSSNLLSITYRPASEACGAYTNISRGRQCWNSSVGCCTKRRRTDGRIHRVKVSYSVEDIDHVEPVDATDDKKGLWIRGIGNCHALRIHFKPKFGCSSDTWDDENNSIIGEEEFEMLLMGESDNLQSPPWKKNNAEKRKYGPIMTFAIPQQTTNEKSHAIHDCPPLLWKVEHPPNARVAVDCMTLMEGSLHIRHHPDIPRPKSPENEANEDNIEVEMETLLKDSSSTASYDVDTPTNVYIHGFQSWSFSGSVVQGEPQPTSAMPDMLSAAFNRGGVVLSKPTSDDLNAFDVDEDEWRDDEQLGAATSEQAVLSADDELNEDTAFYKSDMFACVSSNGTTSMHNEELIILDEEGGPALIVGFLSQREQFGMVLLDSELNEFNLYACHEGVVATKGLGTDWAYCQIVDSSCYDEEAMVYYVHAVGDHNFATPMDKGLTTGWCSWYHYYENIDHDSLAQNAHILEQKRNTIGFNVCLIDDGYMTAWGDWTSLKPGKFVKDGGMRVLADAIRSKGMKPGVWLAPFACDKKSQLAKDHPDWIIKNDSGRYANSANCGKFFYGLDATNPAVRKHVYDTIRRAVEEWGFEVLKLDFLYASCLSGNGKYDSTMSRAEAMHLGLRTIQAAAKNVSGDAFIIGCGCPIGSAVGFVDGMRVSCDTGPTWVPEFPLPSWDNGTLPALRGMLRNTMSRAPFGHRWWHNDPDCILLGDSTKLTDAEVVSAASIVAMTGGMFLLSDDMQKVSDSRLNIAKRIFPLTGVTAVPLDLHSTINKGMPSVLRLWCTEKAPGLSESLPANSMNLSESPKILKDQASKLEYEVGYSPENIIDPYSRERSCFNVASGLGTWTIVSLSNWLDHAAKLHVSFSTLIQHSLKDFNAMGAPDETPTTCELSQCGFHVFSFWTSEYTWIPHQTLADKDPLIKRLAAHETEIFHIKPANPTRPQYIGSDLHFSCGFEVKSFEWTESSIKLSLKNDYEKTGSVFLFIPDPDSKVSAVVNGQKGVVEALAKPAISNNASHESHLGRIVKITVHISGTQIDTDGRVEVSW